MVTIERPLTVVITGGASGIGQEIARAFVKQKCQTFVCDISEDFILKFRQEFPEVLIQRADVSNYEDVCKFFDRVKEHTRSIDVLVNGVGIAGPTSLLEQIKPDEWDRTISTNVNGMFYCLKEAIPLIKNSIAGSIINIASSASFFGFPYRSAYASTKWAVIGMTKTLAMELGNEGIRVNAICPGSVEGARINRVMVADSKEQGKSIAEIRDLYLKQVSLKTFVRPQDVAQLCLFLASDAGKHISGQSIGLDGHTEGLSANL